MLPEKHLLSKQKAQHFLANNSILNEEAKILQPEDMDVLEIGAGDGRLSQNILKYNPKSLALVEIDSYWANYLRKKFSKNKKVKIINSDFLKLPNSHSAQIIAGNIPYNITSKILVKLSKMKFLHAVLCMQKEVVQRICAPSSTSKYGRLSAFCQLHFLLNPLFPISKEFFHPPPKVDSQLVQLIPRKSAKLPKNLDKVSSALFSHRLASVQNALFHSRKLWGWSKQKARKEASKRVKFKERKVFMLAPEEVVEIARTLPGGK
ncbi:MAG: 16S rRNA (adenine(1518)-N(6)/adenine(1519)-N(6))-dimethyltransferase RsmA [Candidatus Micrarchaeota archaeon]